jgi:hypothetical protein
MLPPLSIPRCPSSDCTRLDTIRTRQAKFEALNQAQAAINVLYSCEFKEFDATCALVKKRLDDILDIHRALQFEHALALRERGCEVTIPTPPMLTLDEWDSCLHPTVIVECSMHREAPGEGGLYTCVYRFEVEGYFDELATIDRVIKMYEPLHPACYVRSQVNGLNYNGDKLICIVKCVFAPKV